MKLRDRDAIVTEEGLIFRVFGYSHPPQGYICDAEYAPARIFKSGNPKAFRNSGRNVFFKFYEDEGWRFVNKSFPLYTLYHEPLGKKVVGISLSEIAEVRKPERTLKELVEAEKKDELLCAMQDALEFVCHSSGLSKENFGVFGSMLHGFHHPKFSDIDLIIYGGKNAVKLYETLQELYLQDSSALRNEFETAEAMKGKNWKFQNYSKREYVWHQRRKLIYALFKAQQNGRIIKTEFEPVKEWKEISDKYDSTSRISQRGWVKMLARINGDGDSPFIPSVYAVEPLEVLEGPRNAIEARRVVSYMEEFRMQARRDETVYVEGTLEEVTASKGSFHQVALTYCPRYYEQVLKVVV